MFPINTLSSTLYESHECMQCKGRIPPWNPLKKVRHKTIVFRVPRTRATKTKIQFNGIGKSLHCMTKRLITKNQSTLYVYTF